ncbi:MAG TPA: hypothetical protein VKU83_00595 [Puia sp.]|nr:hypothetical protein [Puia sp.]
MNGLPSGQFVDYLIIGAITSACAVILDLILKSKTVRKRSRIMVIIILVSIAAFTVFVKIRTETNTAVGTNPRSSSTLSPAIISSSPLNHKPEQKINRDLLTAIYVAPPPKKQRKSGQWAVIIVDPKNNQYYPQLTDAVSSAIAQAGQSTVAMFRPAATKGPGFEIFFAADPSLSRRLHEYCDQIVLGEVSSIMQDNSVAPGLLRLSLTINLKIISTGSGEVQHEIHASAMGAGYEADEARSNAEENLAATLGTTLQSAIK